MSVNNYTMVAVVAFLSDDTNGNEVPASEPGQQPPPKRRPGIPI
jgi:hypothetical protein